ncbi:hypothetical protein SH661x_001967 [Planctomicrobium sp. SH661]|uniref:hypothetical protein n=1 Tax=Planctomicrobium sp. SH661 TaxID=3448124 RepID=UPI003F5B8734
MRVLLLWVLLLLCSSASAGDKPILDIWLAGSVAEDHRFPNQLAFVRTYQQDAGLRDAIEASYQVRWFFIEQQPVFAFTRGINCGPSFARQGLPLIRGFRGADVLLAELCLRRRSPAPAAGPQAPPPAPQQLTPEQIRSDLAAALLQDLEQLKQQLQQERDTARAADQAEMIERLQDVNAKLKDVDQLPQQLERLESFYGEIVQQLRRRDTAPVPQVEPLTPTVTPITAPNVQDRSDASSPPSSSIWSRSVRVLSASFTVAELAAFLGVGGSSFGIAGVAVWLLRKVGRRRQWKDPLGGTDEMPTQLAKGDCPRCKMWEGISQSWEKRYQGLLESWDAAATGAEDSPRCAQLQKERYQLVNEVDRLTKEIKQLTAQLAAKNAALPASPVFAPYECDSFREAYEWASRALVERFPGAVNTLETLKEFISQYLSSKGKGKS